MDGFAGLRPELKLPGITERWKRVMIFPASTLSNLPSTHWPSAASALKNC